MDNFDRILRGHGAAGGSGTSHGGADHLSDHDEYRDLNFKAIGQFMVGLIAVVAVSYLSMYGILKVFESQHEKNDLRTSPFTNSAWSAPHPDVQSAPHVDLVEYRERQDSILNHPGSERGAMSIEQAMAAVVSEGLPYRAGMDGDSVLQRSDAPTEPAPADSTAIVPQNAPSSDGEGH